jgi:hypothetical protein
MNLTDGKPHHCPSSMLEKVISMVSPCAPEDELLIALDDLEIGVVFHVALISSKKGELKAKSIGRSKSHWFSI